MNKSFKGSFENASLIGDQQSLNTSISVVSEYTENTVLENEEIRIDVLLHATGELFLKPFAKSLSIEQLDSSQYNSV